jgi:hypothetical protein
MNMNTNDPSAKNPIPSSAASTPANPPPPSSSSPPPAEERGAAHPSSPAAGDGTGSELKAGTGAGTARRGVVGASPFVGLQLGVPQVHRLMVVFPILGPAMDPAVTTAASAGGWSRETNPWLTMGEAMERGVLAIGETSPEGQVPQLVAINDARVPVLLLEGEELVGAKQNRVLNTTVLVPPQSRILIPVSCTERGRWSGESLNFKEAKLLMAQKARARKVQSVSESLERKTGFRSDQREVWAQVADLLNGAGTTSPTGAMHDAFTMRAQELAAMVEAFPLVPGQVGLLVVVGEQVAGFDWIPHADTYARHHAKLVKSYGIDAITAPQPVTAVWADAAQGKAMAFLEQAAQATAERFPSVGLGTDCRCQAPGMVGAALEHEGHVMHGAMFTLPPSAQNRDPDWLIKSVLRSRPRFRTDDL